MTIGRIVLYCLSTGELRPAIVTRVHGQELVDLSVFLALCDQRDDASPFVRPFESVPIWSPSDLNESPAPGTWHWLPRY